MLMNLTLSGRAAVATFEAEVAAAWRKCRNALLVGGLESVPPAPDLSAIPPYDLQQFVETWLRNTAGWVAEQQRLVVS